MPTRRTRRRFDKPGLHLHEPAFRREPHRAAEEVLALAEDAIRTGRRPERIGSDDYRSPEEAHGERRSPAGDVFSLGLLLHEFLTGRRRYEGTSPWGAPAHRLFNTAEHAEALVPGAPPGLRDVVARSLAWEPAERYPDVAAFAHALRQWLANDRVGQTVVARSRSQRVSATWRPTGREAVMLVLALLVIGFVGVRSVSWLGLLEGTSPGSTPEMAVQGAGQSPGPTGPGSTAPQQVDHQRTPRAAVVAFYRRVERGAYDRAHRLMSDSLGLQVSSEQLAERYGDTTAITVESLQVTRSRTRATVAVQALEATASGETRRVQGWWELILENGRWVLDEPSF